MTEINQDFMDAQKEKARLLREAVIAGHAAGAKHFDFDDDAFGTVVVDIDRSMRDEKSSVWGVTSNKKPILFSTEGNIHVMQFFDAIGPVTGNTNLQSPVLGQ